MPDTSNVWMYGVGALIGTVLAAAVAFFGSSRGHSFWLCFVLAVATTPLVAWIILALISERVRPYRPPADLLLAITLEKARMKAQADAAASPAPHSGHTDPAASPARS